MAVTQRWTSTASSPASTAGPNRTRQGWVETAKLIASDAESGDIFGVSMTLEGDTLVAGAPGADNGGDDLGSVYVFTSVP